ncbi:MAG TPA: AMP-binding protein [Pseudonocardia sp.]|jgi:long-chain acyl-CoA synthetase|uniref:AMP-binding protein n=1 Tax=Pseudonocardia sp. TaxID=60912 RepID=UPI002B5CDEEA|nr:AMP-binding protein [Pseudonocardia sp.]HTF45965.1 AMP-binding protein [Pseudonocardia sp.]
MNSPQIHCGDRSRSRDEALQRAARIAGGLAELGVQPGDRVAVVLRNDIEFLEVSLGIGQLGAIPVPVNWHWKGAELAYLLADCGATAVFAHRDLAPVVADALSTPVPIIEVVPSAALRQAYQLPDELPAIGQLELESWLDGHTELVDTPPTPPLSVIYTSGTTGQPKGILRTPMTPEQSVHVTQRLFRAFGLTLEQRTLVPAPMYHSAPNVHALFAVAAGIDLTIMPRFEPVEFLATIERHRIAHTQVVPTMFVRLLRLPEEQRRSFDLSSLEAVVHAAAPCSPEVKRRMIDWFGPIILEYYGGSETGTVVACDSAEWLAHPGTVGRAMDGCDIRIYQPDGTQAPTGSFGEIYIQTGVSWPDFTYIGNDVKRKQMERDGYVSIGDGGWLDGDGFLYLSDRINDMVISGGVNIYPAEIEQFLITVPGVRDVAVFGIPDGEYGEVLAAHVDTDPDSGLTEDDLREHVRSNLANYKVPKVVVLDRELPREESGKLFKRRIRERYINPV